MEWKPSLWMCVSAFFYSLQHLSVKLLSRHYSVWWIIFARGIVGSSVTLTILLILKIQPLLGKNPFQLTLRGTYASLNIMLGFFALFYLQMSVATILFTTSSIWICVLTRCGGCTHEWPLLNNVGTLVSITGVGLLTWCHIQRDLISTWGIFFALASSFFNALSNITLRSVRDESSWVICLYSMIFCLVGSIPGLFCVEKPTTLAIQDLELVSTGVFSLLALQLKTMAIQQSSNMGIVLFRYLDVVFSCLFDYWIFHNRYGPYDWTGMVLIVVGSLIRKY